MLWSGWTTKRQSPVSANLTPRIVAHASPSRFLCMSGTESIVADVSPAGWSEPVEMQYSNTDTLTLKQLQLTLRHGETTGQATGRYVVETISPSGAAVRDTLTISILPDTQRNRLGEAWATIRGVRFAETGDYRFVVHPLRNTSGVWSVGIDLK